MTNFARGCAALTITVLAGVTAGCSSSADSATAKPDVGKTYCAPLRVAVDFQKTFPDGKLDLASQKKFVKMLEPVAAAAKKDRKTDVAAWFALIVKVSANPMAITPQEGTALRDGAKTLSPVLLKECGTDLAL